MRDYYSEELLWSQEARQRWVAPDLQPHPGSTFVATGDHG
jgi:hypothetical protein